MYTRMIGSCGTELIKYLVNQLHASFLLYFEDGKTFKCIKMSVIRLSGMNMNMT